MQDSLLMLMTPGMSLEKWDALGQLSRELNFYEQLSKRSNLKLIIFSYGRHDLNYDQVQATILTMPIWIPKGIPFRIQNLLYNLSSLIIYRKFFRKVLFCKTNQFSAAYFGLLLKFIYGIPLIIRMGFYYSHFKKTSRLQRLGEKIAFGKANLILTTSLEANDFIKESYNIPSSKILTIFNSINLQRFRPLNYSKEWDVIFVAKLEEQKNIWVVLEVLSKIDGKVLIIGNGSLDYLVEEAVKNNSNINWRKRVDNVDLPNYYNRSKCFILLSDHEGNPKVLLEAMACGLPCVVTNVPGIRECISHNVNGIIVPKDATEIFEAIKYLLSDKNRIEMISRNAIIWIEKHCDYSKNIDREIKFYLESEFYKQKI